MKEERVAKQLVETQQINLMLGVDARCAPSWPSR
jgi:hypothetical protein